MELQMKAWMAASASPTAPYTASAAPANAPAGQSSEAPGAAASGVDDHVPVPHGTQPSCVSPEASTGLVLHLNAAARAPDQLQTRPSPPPFMPGCKVPGRDLLQWQDLKHTAFSTIGGEFALHTFRIIAALA